VVSHEEITALKLSEEALRKSEAQLTLQKVELEESNIALKVLLKQREGDKSELEQKVITNVKEMVIALPGKAQTGQPETQRQDGGRYHRRPTCRTSSHQ
jgi:hypothetical protein